MTVDTQRRGEGKINGVEDNETPVLFSLFISDAAKGDGNFLSDLTILANYLTAV